MPTLATGLLVLTGCHAYPTAPAADGVTVEFQASVHAGGFRVQADLLPYGVADVDHLYLKLFTVVGVLPGEVETAVVDGSTAPIVLDIARDAAEGLYVDAPLVSVTQLRHNTHYRIKAVAYADGDDMTGTQISVDGTGSQTDLMVGVDETAAVVQSTVQVQLADKLFNGQAGGLISVTPGGFTSVP